LSLILAHARSSQRLMMPLVGNNPLKIAASSGAPRSAVTEFLI